MIVLWGNLQRAQGSHTQKSPRISSKERAHIHKPNMYEYIYMYIYIYIKYFNFDVKWPSALEGFRVG